MMRWKLLMALAGGFVVVALAATQSGLASAGVHPATGVGSCTLKNWDPGDDPADAKDLPEGQRPQSYRPDDYNCTGAKFAANGSEFTKFPQPHNFNIINQQTTRTIPACTHGVNMGAISAASYVASGMAECSQR